MGTQQTDTQSPLI